MDKLGSSSVSVIQTMDPRPRNRRKPGKGAGMQARVRLPEFSFPRGALVDTAAGEIPLNSLGPARKPLHAVGAARGSGVCEDGGEQAEILRSTQQAVRAFRKRSLGCAAPPLQRLVRVAQQQGGGGAEGAWREGRIRF